MSKVPINARIDAALKERALTVCRQRGGLALTHLIAEALDAHLTGLERRRQAGDEFIAAPTPPRPTSRESHE